VRIRSSGTPAKPRRSKLLTVVAGGRIVLPAALLPFDRQEGLDPLVKWRLSPVRGSGAAAVAYQAVRQP
jgi:hypothetical protein